LGGFAAFAKLFKCCSIARIKEKPPLGRKAATLIVQGNNSLTIIISLSEKLNEFRTVARTQ
jgi:hypothetical protein